MTNTTVWLIVTNTNPYELLDVALAENQVQQKVEFYQEEVPDNKVFAVPHTIVLSTEVFMHLFYEGNKGGRSDRLF